MNLDPLPVRTPVTPAGLVQYDQLHPVDAVAAAWTRPGCAPAWHLRCQSDVRRVMPVLARNIQRLAATAPDPGWRDTVLTRAREALEPAGAALSANTLREILRDLIELTEPQETPHV